MSSSQTGLSIGVETHSLELWSFHFLYKALTQHVQKSVGLFQEERYLTRNKFVLKKLSWAGKSSGDCTLDFPSVPFYNSGLYGSMAEDAVYMISDRGAQVGVCRLHRPLPIKMSSTDRVCLTCISQWSYPPLERDLFSSIESGALGGRRCLRALIEFHFPSSPHAPLYWRSRLAHRMCVELDGFRRGITLLIVTNIYLILSRVLEMLASLSYLQRLFIIQTLFGNLIGFGNLFCIQGRELDSLSKKGHTSLC